MTLSGEVVEYDVRILFRDVHGPRSGRDGYCFHRRKSACFGSLVRMYHAIPVCTECRVVVGVPS
jgi:hypothetical protein